MAAPMQQHIFMTGATGYIGLRVTEFALREGYTVHGLSRSASGAAKLRSLGAVPVSGDLSSLDVLRTEAARADIVLHLADAWIDDFSQPYENVIKIDGRAVDAMVEGLAQSPSARKLFVGTSGTANVEPAIDDGETDEDAPEAARPLNGRTRCEEHALSRASASGGPRVCMLRLPPFVYGRAGSGVRRFMDIFAKLGAVVRLGDGAARTCVVHVDDAARAYLIAARRACVDPDRIRGVYNITSSTEVTFREFTDAMAAALEVPVKEMSAAEVAETAGPFIAGFFALRNRANSDKARRELGWIPAEIDIIEDIRAGSYFQVAKELKGAASSQT